MNLRFSISFVPVVLMSKPLSAIFVKNVMRIYQMSGESQATIAKRGKFSQGGFSDLLTNIDLLPNPTLELMERIATGLGVPLTVLLTDPDDPVQSLPVNDKYSTVSFVVPEIVAVQMKFQVERYKDALKTAIREGAMNRPNYYNKN